MDRLRSPGGCPWDAAQTHESLTRYLVEETYEVLEAIETGDQVLLREELGDLLLQVLFHARIAQEAPAPAAFDIDDVAGDLVDKLVRRHPHVFGDEQVRSSVELDDLWERRKAAEKGRSSAVDGVPLAQPALALAAKLVSRATRAGLATAAAHALEAQSVDDIEAAVGARLLAAVSEAVAHGVDPEGALRATARRYGAAVRDAETAAGDA